MRDLLGVTSVSDSRVSDLLVGDFDGPISTAAWQIYQDVGEKIARMVMTGPNRSKFISCDPAQAGCLDDTIKTFGRKAFRRPLSVDELARFQQLGKTTPAPTAEELAETTLYAFLVSPSFLMLPELATDKPANDIVGTGVRLSSHEVATRLSMFVWGSIPDDQLNEAADKDALQDKEAILAQAKRMLLVKEKATPMLEAFHQRWTHIDDASGHWYKSRHDTAKYPLYSDKASAIMPAEMNAFFDDVMFGHGTFKDYFLSTAAFVNQDNAAIYGLDPKGFGSDLKRVELDAMQRSGFLTRAGFLSSYANYESTSPFMRGTFISLNLLGIEIPTPSPTANTLLTGDYKTNREYLTALTSPPDCNRCHAILNPFGFALENYDAIGAWQTVDPRGGAIDAAVTITSGSGQPSKQISSPQQLMQELASLPAVQRIYAQSWVSFAYGRKPSWEDQCVVGALAAKLASDGYELLSVPAELTQAESFSTRARGML